MFSIENIRVERGQQDHVGIISAATNLLRVREHVANAVQKRLDDRMSSNDVCPSLISQLHRWPEDRWIFFESHSPPLSYAIIPQVVKTPPEVRGGRLSLVATIDDPHAIHEIRCIRITQMEPHPGSLPAEMQAAAARHAR